MGQITLLLVIAVVCLFVSQLSAIFKAFKAYRCPPENLESNGACYHPMLKENEQVEFYIYLTCNASIRWWTPSGMKELRQVLFWNSSSYQFGQALPARQVVLPLSDSRLAGVRRNESMLYAHLFLVRGGTGSEKALDEAALMWKKSKRAPDRGVMSDDVIHTRSIITRLLPQQQQRRNLLGNASETRPGPEGVEEDAPEGAKQETGTTSTDETPAVHTELPLLGWKLAIWPDDALTWIVAIFSLSAFLDPGPFAAAVRHFIAVILFPWFIQLLQEQRATLRLREGQEELWWSQQTQVLAPHMAPLIRIALAADNEAYDAVHPPPLLYQEMVFHEGSPFPLGDRPIRYHIIGDKNDKTLPMYYTPPLSMDLFGIQERFWRPLSSNASQPDPEVPVEVDVSGMIKYSLVETGKQSLDMYLRMGFTERDLDDIKDFFFRYPLHIMALMQVISMMQVALTTLAFKNDISFFRGRSDYTGLSSRTLATDTLQDIIIFLYLYDYEGISRIVLAQIGISALIGAWKYMRVAKLRIHWAYLLPWISHNRGTGDDESEEERNTEEIDARGMLYLKWVLYPLSAVWGLYNLYNYSYKGWWSWLISSMADFAYTFGFINMMPQIFINYRLKSVAHMPWRVLMYKFFNTFIDDVFAFFIMSDYMSKKHRMMTLRDDIVFFVFIYQRHIYKVDPKRADEYGFVYTDASAPEELQDTASTAAVLEKNEGTATEKEKSDKKEDSEEKEEKQVKEDLEDEADSEKENMADKSSKDDRECRRRNHPVPTKE